MMTEKRKEIILKNDRQKEKERKNICWQNESVEKNINRKLCKW